MNWYDINGEQTVNGETMGLFASILARSESEARAQFFIRFPYGKILVLRKIGE